MNAAYINPFIQGAQSVFSTLCDESPALGKLFIKNAPYNPSPLTVAVSVFGDFAGEVIYNMQENDGCFVASKMMFGMPVTALDEMSQSAVSELANMISGNVATVFAGKGIKIDITPPRLRFNATSADFQTFSQVEKIVCIPLLFAAGHTFEVDIMIP